MSPPYHILRDVKTIIIVAMILATVCIITYIIAECAKSVARLNNEVPLAQKYAELARQEAVKAEEQTKQAVLERLEPSKTTASRLGCAVAEVTNQLRGGR